MQSDKILIETIMDKIFVFLVFSFTTCFTFADYSDASVQFNELLQKVETISGVFSQKIVNADGEEVSDETTGEVKIQRPGYFYWQVEPPYEQLIIGTPEQLIVYDPDLETVNIKKGNSLDGTPAMILSGNAEAIHRDYHVEKFIDDKKLVFTLVDKLNQDENFKSLTFEFNEQKIQRIVLLDNLNQTVKISFKEVLYNEDLPDGVFTFVPPPGIDVIIDE